MDCKLAHECAMRLFTEQLWTLLDDDYTLRKLYPCCKTRAEVEYYRNGESAKTLELSLDKGEMNRRDGGFGPAYWHRPPSWRVRCGSTLLASFYFYVDPAKGVDLEVDEGRRK